MPYQIQQKDYLIDVGPIGLSLPLYLAGLENEYSKVFILVDENTKEHCLDILLNSNTTLKNAQVIEIKSGEENKTIDTCQFIWKELLEKGADRRSLLINLGGGVIGDMGGFAASTYMRGIDFIQVPTTLLAQVDASIGGKLGIDFEWIKNAIGLFKNPNVVFIDPVFLQSLDNRQIKSGFAEMIKHALIKDGKYLTRLQQINPDNTVDWESLIYQSLLIKKDVVEADPYEKGLRKILNFGHTLGHAIESYSLQNDEAPLLHGEAIANGMVMEIIMSIKLKRFPPKEAIAICDYLMRLYPKVELPEASTEEILKLVSKDKKNEGKKVNFTLLENIGNSVYNEEADEEVILATLNAYREYIDRYVD